MGFWFIKLNGVEPCVLKAYFYQYCQVYSMLWSQTIHTLLEMVHNVTFQTFTRPGCSNDGRP